MCSRSFVGIKNALSSAELSYDYLDLSALLAYVEHHRSIYDGNEDYRDSPELFVFPLMREFIQIVELLDKTDLQINTWFVFSDSSSSDQTLEDLVLTRLNLRSMLYLFEERKIVEWYRIGDEVEHLTKQVLGVFGADRKFRFTAEQFIWERRADLRGYVFRTVYILNKPFVYKVERLLLTSVVVIAVVGTAAVVCDSHFSQS